MQNFTIYSKDGCPYCEKIAEVMKIANLNHVIYKLDEHFTKDGFYDATKFELVDSIGNVFNRLFIFDAQHIHAASQYFGTNKEDSRLFHIFFFD